jgi:hypothetical protein
LPALAASGSAALQIRNPIKTQRSMLMPRILPIEPRLRRTVWAPSKVRWLS